MISLIWDQILVVFFFNPEFWGEGHALLLLRWALLNAHSGLHFAQMEFWKACPSAATQNISALRHNSTLLCDIIIEFSLEHCMLY